MFRLQFSNKQFSIKGISRRRYVYNVQYVCVQQNEYISHNTNRVNAFETYNFLSVGVLCELFIWRFSSRVSMFLNEKHM